MNSDYDSTRLPNLLGIGAPKAATTWLAGVLAQHPEVYTPPAKELNVLHYLDFEGRLPEYLGYFDAAGAAKVRCDFSTRYLASPRAVDRAANLIPDAKLLVCLRDPVKQVQSHYWHLRRQNFHQWAPLARSPDVFEALERFPELLLEPALYGKHLARWLAHFPRERLWVILADDLRPDPAPTLSKLCAFLGIAADPATVQCMLAAPRDARAGVQPRSAGWERVYRRLYTGLARGPYRWTKEVFGVNRADAIKRLLRVRRVFELVFFTPGYPTLSIEEERRLRRVFDDDLCLLQELLDRDLDGWRSGVAA